MLLSPMRIAAIVFLTSAHDLGQAATMTSLTDDFEAESLALNYSGFAHWTVADGTVDTVGPTFGTPPINCQGSSVCVDLDGSTFDAGLFSTAGSFAAGSYRLSFDLSGSQRADTNTVTVAFGDLLEDFTLPGGAAWTTIVRRVTLASEDVLSFQNSGGADNSGLLLDNVSVTVIPLPAAAGLFVSAIGLLGWMRRATGSGNPSTWRMRRGGPAG